MSTAANVSSAKPKVGGGVSIGAAGGTCPTDATSTITGFNSLGYVSEDGVTNGFSKTSTDVKAWGGDTVMSLLTETKDTFKFKLIENINPDVLKAVFGDSNVTVETVPASGDVPEFDRIKVSVKGEEAPLKGFCIDTILNADTVKRLYIPNGKVTEVSEIVYKDDEPIGYEVTVTAFPDLTGVTHYEIIE